MKQQGKASPFVNRVIATFFQEPVVPASTPHNVNPHPISPTHPKDKGTQPKSFLSDEYLAEEARIVREMSDQASSEIIPWSMKEHLETEDTEPSDEESDEGDEEVDYALIHKMKRKRKKQRRKNKKKQSAQPNASVDKTVSEPPDDAGLSKNQTRKIKKKRRLKELKEEGVIVVGTKKRKLDETFAVAPTFVYLPTQGQPTESPPEETKEHEGHPQPQPQQPPSMPLSDETYRNFMMQFREYSTLSREDEVLEFYNAILQQMRKNFKEGGPKEPSAVKQMHQTEFHCSKLFNMLKRRTLSKKIVEGLLVIKRQMVLQRFEDANQKYFDLNIGNAAWPSTAPSPIGSALKTKELRERKEKEAKEKEKEKEKDVVEEEDDGGAAIEEAGKLMLHGVKRLMTFFQQEIASPYISKDRQIEKEDKEEEEEEETQIAKEHKGSHNRLGLFQD